MLSSVLFMLGLSECLFEYRSMSLLPDRTDSLNNIGLLLLTNPNGVFDIGLPASALPLDLALVFVTAATVYYSYC